MVAKKSAELSVIFTRAQRITKYEFHPATEHYFTELKKYADLIM
jgi:hypothetical protein